MYGMVNKTLMDMVTKTHGPEVWQQIREQAHVDDELFISNEAYPDDITYALVTAASNVLRRPATELLEDFGVHWILTAAKSHYASLLHAGGSSFPEFLKALPAFHSRVALIFPDLRPPVFSVTDITAHSLQLHYESERAGLCPFVVGLIRGLGQTFGTSVDISQVAVKTQGAPHDVFLIEWQTVAAH